MKKPRNRYTPCTIPTYLSQPTDWSGLIVNATHFLLENVGSCHGHWIGKMNASDQRRLFGEAYFGRRTIHVDGEREEVIGTKTACFGSDFVRCDTMNLKTGSVLSNGKRAKQDFWNAEPVVVQN